MRSLILTLLFLPTVTRAQQAGWGNVGKQEEPAFSWTSPLFGGTWMAWTAATLAIFVFVFGAMAILTAIEIRHPGGAERRGVLGLTTTRGDRLFISLLGSVFIFLGWLWQSDAALWTPLGLAILWGTFCFWKV
ncbi:DUF2160 domain-containing protein [Halovulum sp. GXIMD14793]